MKKRMQMLGVCRVDLLRSNSAVSSAKSTSLIKNDLVLVLVVVAISSISLGLIQDHYIGITHMLWDLSMVQIENQEYCTYEEGWCILVLFQNFGCFFFHCRETFHLQVYKCLASVSYGWVPRSVISGSKGVCVRLSETGDILRLYLY